MTKQDAHYLAQTVSRLERSRVADRDPVADALKLHSIAGSLHRYAERACSVEMSEAETQRIERRVLNLEAKAREIATAYGFRAYFQGDCRGCPLYLIPNDSIPAFPPYFGPKGGEGSEVDEWVGSHYSSVGHAVPWLG